MMTEQAGPKDLVGARGGRRGGRLRLRGVQRPLLPVAGRDGPLAARVDGARRRRAGHQPHPAHDLRDLPDLPVPPGGRGPEGRDAADPVRRPVHPRPGRGGEPQRARRRRRLAAGRRPAGDARRGAADHPRALRRRGLHQLPRRALRRRVGQALGPPEKRVPIGVAVSGKQSCRDRRRARRRDDRASSRRPSSASGSTPPAARASRGSGRCRSASTPTRTPPSPGRTGCSAGSASAGRSTPSCPDRRPSTPPASSSARRTSPRSIPCGDDVDAVIEAAKEYADAGFTHLALVQIGGDQQVPYLEWSRDDPDAGLAGGVRRLTRRDMHGPVGVRSPANGRRAGGSGPSNIAA